jgi:hypothetical protein
MLSCSTGALGTPDAGRRGGEGPPPGASFAPDDSTCNLIAVDHGFFADGIEKGTKLSFMVTCLTFGCSTNAEKVGSLLD